MDGLELISFNIISEVGTAKSLVMEGLELSRNGNFDEANKKINLANENLNNAQKEHFSVITNEAKGDEITLTLLFIHAEDQLLTTSTLRDLALEIIEMNKNIYNLKNEISKINK